MITASGHPFRGRLPDPRSGLSLLELLVALTIAAMLIATVSLSFSLAEDEDRRAAESVLQQLRRAEMDAVASGRPVGLLLEENGARYVFLTYADGEWRPLRDRPGLRGGLIAEDLRLSLSGADARRAERRRQAALIGRGAAAEDAPPIPDIWFDPAGLTDPFRLGLENAERRFELAWDEAGDPVLRELDA